MPVQPAEMDFRERRAIKPGVAATCFYLVVAESDGDVAAYEIAPPHVARTSTIAVENQGEGGERIWHAAADALAAVMPEDEDWAALDADELRRPPTTSRGDA